MHRWFWTIDVLVVVVFVVAGREDHGFTSDIGDYLRVSAPFLIGLGASIPALRAWRRPTAWLTGVGLAIGTIVIGMVLRRLVWDAGTATTFVLVASGFILAGMVGWRLVVTALSAFLDDRRARAA